MRCLLTCGAMFGLLLAVNPEVFAQDLKKGVTDLAHVDADYHLQGEYSGYVLFSDGKERKVGLQVVALGDGKFGGMWYQGGLPGNGYDGTERKKLAGGRAGRGAELLAEGLSVELALNELAQVRTSAGGRLGALQAVVRTSRTMGAVPPANAIVLFDGKSVDRLKNARVTADGLLEIGAETRSPVQNFTMHAEFRTPYMPYARSQARGNSGFYLQKRYEVQVLDSFGQELRFDDCAALYKFKAPDLNMCFPPLTWQTYDIDFKAPRFDKEGVRTEKGRITVRHNGILVQRNVELANKTGGGSPEGPNPLPILFQNHGNAVHFRNLWLVDHDAPAPEPAAPAPTCCEPGTCDCCVIRPRRGWRCR